MPFLWQMGAAAPLTASALPRPINLAFHRKECVMLVLSRKAGEAIVINDDVIVTIVEIRGDKVRLGVEAPKETPVHRREVFDAIRRSEAQGNQE
jgi:carbon storage regulator